MVSTVGHDVGHDYVGLVALGGALARCFVSAVAKGGKEGIMAEGGPVQSREGAVQL
eukprot:CAMPEP_0178513286 /NCGR_PEP_ID=MMETSP0696-20121128/23389_1 /TAXON_ID=265572 /ORGANISM="Extubocellulus spinifer, Strain CCMP396" /LENGTH=55 /DNA_ID=CAMNT_0020143265 /DNA_START=277 /DNA_END=444 /DNA_ORIENTATION=-